MSETNIDERIEQWERMAEQAPDDMAFFSLGQAYRDAERYGDAADAFERAIGFNRGMSRAYQLLAECLLRLERDDEAKDALLSGYKHAAERGDVKPKEAIEEMLAEIDVPLPEVKTAAERQAELDAQAAESGGRPMVVDRRTGQPQPRLADPPMRGPLGAFIFEHFGQVTWTQWIGQGTKVINELRLDLSKPEHQDVYEQHMLEWLGITDADLPG